MGACFIETFVGRDRQSICGGHDLQGLGRSQRHYAVWIPRFYLQAFPREQSISPVLIIT